MARAGKISAGSKSRRPRRAAGARSPINHLGERTCRHIIDDSRDGIALVQGNRLIFANAAFCSIFGYGVKEILGKPFLGLVAPADRNLIRERAAKMFAQKSVPTRYTFRGRRKDGSIIVVEVSVSLVAEHGFEPMILAFCRDATRRVTLERELREERDKLQKYLDIAGVIFVVLDARGRVALINKKGEEIFGYKSEDILGKNWFSHFIPAGERQAVRAVFRDLITGKREPAEYYQNNILTRAGKKRIISWHNTILRDNSGRITATLSSGEDVTERVRAQKALAQSEERFRTVADFAYDWEYWISPEGNCLYISPSCERITGYGSDEFMKQSGLLQTIIHPDDRSIFSQHLSDYCGAGISNKVPGRVDFRIITRSGEERWIGHVCQPVHGADGSWQGRRASNRDVTELKRLEGELRKHQCELEEMVRQRTEALESINQELLVEINERKRIERALRDSEEHLRENKRGLEEKNIALREILEQIGEEKKKFKDDVVTNIDNLVLPILRKLESEEGRYKHDYLELLKRNLQELATSFGKKLVEPRLKLTPREIEICDMIKTGMSTKEIAGLLRISKKTVDKHRDNIRRKLDIVKKGFNLSTYLQTL